MKYVFQAGIIIGISFVGEMLNLLIPLPIPGSVYGMVLLFLLLLFKIIPLEKIEATGNFFLSIMPLLFISPNVGIMTSLNLLKKNIWSVLLVSVVSTLVVMSVTSVVAQLMSKVGKRGNSNE